MLSSLLLALAIAAPAASQSSPEVRGAGEWSEAVSKAKAHLQRFSLEDKVSLATGVGWMNGRCVGNIAAQPHNGFPGLCLEDSPMGVRFADFVSAFPSSVNAASTFDRELIRQRGAAMGREFKNKGVHVALGPMMNMGRVAEGGRNWEGFGGDPYLAGEAAYETIVGMQREGVQACAKHFINNEQEFARTTSSSNVDDRTQHEVYLHPFLRSVQAGVASVMCSYNLINGTWACENSEAQNHLLKTELGFQGYILSDWQATHSTESANAGLDMTMPGDITFQSGDSYFGANLTAAVRNGVVSESRVDDMATRILAGWYLLGQDQGYPEVNFDAFQPLNETTNDHVDVQEDHYDLIRKIGASSTVLLKNDKGTLPLVRPRSLVMVGSDAGPSIKGPNGYADRGGFDGILAQGWGSGTADYPYLISPLEAIQARARRTRTSVSWWLDDFDLTGAGNAVKGKDIALVFIASDSGEEYITVDGNMGDRKNITAWKGGDDLVLAVAAQQNNTVVVVHSVGPIIMEPWIEHPNVTAVLWAGLPGQEAGNSLVDILWGDWNPSGRLPYTIAKRPEDYSARIIPGELQIPYTEGLNIDYRHFDAQGITPRFPFGFGLSYTRFEYSGLSVTQQDWTWGDKEEIWSQGGVASREIGSSVEDWLHRKTWSVSFHVKNVGNSFGCEIPQLYISLPASANAPPSMLRGFEKILLHPGETQRVTLSLSRYDVSSWSVEQQGWVRPDGTIGITVGGHSRDKRLTGELTI